MGIKELIRPKRDKILEIALRHGAKNIRVFGSVARGEAGPDSDIDFLIDVGTVRSSWFPAGLILDLEDLLKRKVEVITEASLYHALKDRILKEAVPL